jgi:hypothetical protein
LLEEAVGDYESIGIQLLRVLGDRRLPSGQNQESAGEHGIRLGDMPRDDQPYPAV